MHFATPTMAFKIFIAFNQIFQIGNSFTNLKNQSNKHQGTLKSHSPAHPLLVPLFLLLIPSPSDNYSDFVCVLSVFSTQMQGNYLYRHKHL